MPPFSILSSYFLIFIIQFLLFNFYYLNSIVQFLLFKFYYSIFLFYFFHLILIFCFLSFAPHTQITYVRANRPDSIRRLRSPSIKGISPFSVSPKRDANNSNDSHDFSNNSSNNNISNNLNLINTTTNNNNNNNNSNINIASSPVSGNFESKKANLAAKLYSKNSAFSERNSFSSENNNTEVNLINLNNIKNNNNTNMQNVLEVKSLSSSIDISSIQNNTNISQISALNEEELEDAWSPLQLDNPEYPLLYMELGEYEVRMGVWNNFEKCFELR